MLTVFPAPAFEMVPVRPVSTLGAGRLGGEEEGPGRSS
jgi:hypothetical protein